MNDLILATGAGYRGYTFHNRISAGSFGKVFKVFKDHIIYAAKVIPLIKLLEHDGLVGVLVKNEVEAMTKLQGSLSIVQFIEYFETSFDACIIMEFCEGGTLKDKLDLVGCFDEDIALMYFNELIYGFQEMHKKSIIHRDIKTTNILFRNNHIKIADFGFCELLQNNQQKVQLSLGSIGYEAPEILKFKEYGIEVDLFSCGIILFEMLFGYIPFASEDRQSFFKSIRSPVLLEYFKSKKISKDIEELIISMLQEEPHQRLKWSQLYQNKLITQRMDKQQSQICSQKYAEIEHMSQKLTQQQHVIPSTLGKSKIQYDLADALDPLQYLLNTLQFISEFQHKDYKIAIIPNFLIISQAKQLIKQYIELYEESQPIKESVHSSNRKLIPLRQSFHQVKQSNYLARDFGLFLDNRKNEDTLTLKQYLENYLQEQLITINLAYDFHLKTLKYNYAKLLKLPQEQFNSIIENYSTHYEKELLDYHLKVEQITDPKFDIKNCLSLKVHILNCRRAINYKIADSFSDVNQWQLSVLNTRIDELRQQQP